MTYMAWFAWWLFHGILAEWQPTRTHHSQKPAIVQPPNKILLTSSKSTINYDPALKFTTRITFLTSIPPAERYGRDPEVYSVYLHVEPCRAMSSHVEPCRAMSSHVEPRAATEVEIKILEMPSLKSCKVKSRSCWSCQQGDILTQQERFRERIVGQCRPFHEIKIIRVIRGCDEFRFWSCVGNLSSQGSLLRTGSFLPLV